MNIPNQERPGSRSILGLNNLARLYQEQKRYDEAETLYRRALAIREATLCPEHPVEAVREVK